MKSIGKFNINIEDTCSDLTEQEVYFILVGSNRLSAQSVRTRRNG